MVWEDVYLLLIKKRNKLAQLFILMVHLISQIINESLADILSETESCDIICNFADWPDGSTEFQTALRY